ncbi:MAG TPA: S53 family peptidase [Geminicoccus sp.]|uniref:S53 family peptidase n=1 Tax=Geminicoccus sp. TaxID=2024832 RepID=UPI002BF3C653|nr:S53 family peptidase [Geminicoccus sp.]HWL67755.1 S53 family peptidase [Geminicoccus sp.]
MATIENSTYLDLTSYRATDKTTVAEVFDLDASAIEQAAADTTVRVALTLERTEDPSPLLAADWATRQATLAEMKADGSLWSSFGADPASHAGVAAELSAAGYRLLDVQDGYVASAESRTVWVELDAKQFNELFGTPLMVADADDPASSFLFWNGHLSLPDDLAGAVEGVWFDFGAPDGANGLVTGEVELPDGAQSIGNGTGAIQSRSPAEIAELFHFPITDEDVETGRIGLIEPGIGSAMPEDSVISFQEGLDNYRQEIGLDGAGRYYVVNAAQQAWDPDFATERSLDVGVVAGAAPNSEIGLYAGSGPNGTVFTAYQSAIWDEQHDPGVLSSSFSDFSMPSPDSPFAAAYQELFVDAALRGQSVFIALGDGGSGGLIANGLTNVESISSSPYAVAVGGTSFSTNAAAEADDTLQDLMARAEDGDLDLLQLLVAGGLQELPGVAPDTAKLVETVWNEYFRSGDVLLPGYDSNAATAGGVDPNQPTPWYQEAFGLTPTASDPLAETGRGVPDVAAPAGGNLFYFTPADDLQSFDNLGGGTSASAPFWAALGAQINAVFEDQGLPRLGYMNDLLYVAATVAPGAFNDIQLGNNTSSHVDGPPADDFSTDALVPTGFGYEAGPGYDLVSGLGSPNGLLLTRALTTIAHSQSGPALPGVMDLDNGRSAVDQSLLLQPSLATGADLELQGGGDGYRWNGAPGSPHAWSSQFAQQAMQGDFSADLVRLFDEASQGPALQFDARQGDELQVGIGGEDAAMFRESLSNHYGFVDYTTADLDSALRVARSVAVAETAGDADGQEAIVRVRQNGKLESSLLFYEVDDLLGTIDGLAPGDAGYAEASLSRGYETGSGERWISGPGFGEYLETSILDVDDGDLIAMRLSNKQGDFWGFAQANEPEDGQQVAHLWNYGLNTWGWEDMRGGDFDYNDIVVQLDFVSTSGRALVA